MNTVVSHPGLANALVTLLEPWVNNPPAGKIFLAIAIPVFLILWACLWLYSRRSNHQSKVGEPIRLFHLIGLAALVATPAYLLIGWSGTLLVVMGLFLAISLAQAHGNPVRALRFFGKNLIFLGLAFAALDTGFILLGR